MPLVQTRGAASAQGFGEFAQASGPANYIEDMFSCFLYTGTGAAQTITNGIDLSTKGGLAWLKMRNFNQGHILFDTIRGVENYLQSASSDEQYNLANSLTAFNTTGFTVGSGASVSAEPYVSWSFRKQPKFFDMVSWTGSGSNRTISHSLGSVPACILVKRTDTAANWAVYHRSLANTQYLVLNSTAAVATGATRWNSTTPTSAVFSLGTDASVNASGGTYVAYIFAHDAGGFGLSGTDNVISCGSFTTDAVNGNASVNLGYEPQWLLVKTTSESGNWRLVDNMRGMTVNYSNAILSANLANAESTGSFFAPSATGFEATGLGASVSFIYIAIRRGPMKVPTLGTSVFEPVAYTGTGAARTIDTSQPYLDSYIVRRLPGSGDNTNWLGRLTGSNALQTNDTLAEGSIGSINWASQDLSFTGANYNTNNSAQNYVAWTFARAPSFFDEVCYTGDGTAGTSRNHNLGVAPQLMIIKRRSAASYNGWPVYVPTSTAPRTNVCLLNTTGAAADTSYFNSATPTSTVFYTDDHQDVNASGNTYVAYLFATSGVSKVGRYTGNGSTQTIDCGFTGGARFVMIKATNRTGDWMVSDSARGIVSGNDPYLALNNTNAEVTGEDWLDTNSTGFVVNEVSGSNANTNGDIFIFLAIA